MNGVRTTPAHSHILLLLSEALHLCSALHPVTFVATDETTTIWAINSLSNNASESLRCCCLPTLPLNPLHWVPQPYLSVRVELQSVKPSKQHLACQSRWSSPRKPWKLRGFPARAHVLVLAFQDEDSSVSAHFQPYKPFVPAKTEPEAEQDSGQQVVWLFFLTLRFTFCAYAAGAAAMAGIMIVAGEQGLLVSGRKICRKMCNLSFVLGWQRINRSEMLALLFVGKKI